MKKYLLLSLLAVSQIVSANCNLKSASILENQHKVGPVLQLSNTFNPTQGRCSVSYQIEVDGEAHVVEYSATGPEREDILCGYAVERSRRQLLLNLGGQFKTEAKMVCNDGEPVKTSIKIGDTILENEVGMNDRLNFYWPYKKYGKCRIFKERYVRNKEPVEYHGVICQKTESDWIVVDKW
jgi:hypothetical protein